MNSGMKCVYYYVVIIWCDYKGGINQGGMENLCRRGKPFAEVETKTLINPLLQGNL